MELEQVNELPYGWTLDDWAEVSYNEREVVWEFLRGIIDAGGKAVRIVDVYRNLAQARRALLIVQQLASVIENFDRLRTDLLPLGHR